MEFLVPLVFFAVGVYVLYWTVRYAVRHALEDADERRGERREAVPPATRRERGGGDEAEDHRGADGGNGRSIGSLRPLPERIPMDTMDSQQWTEVVDPARLREIVGDVMPQAAAKERARLHEHDRAWLAASPYCVLATADADGNCDASPKGDPAGRLVHVLDDATVALPERKGNKRVDGYHNVLANPHVGILSLIPGRRETLRINGRARIVSDAPFFADMVVKGHRPILALVVEIDTIYFHCGKSAMRSGVWRPETWNPDALPSHARMVKETQAVERTLDELTEYYGEQYERQLY